MFLLYTEVNLKTTYEITLQVQIKIYSTRRIYGFTVCEYDLQAAGLYFCFFEMCGLLQYSVNTIVFLILTPVRCFVNMNYCAVQKSVHKTKLNNIIP